MKKYLYVDTENTGLNFLNVIGHLGKSWKMIVFYSDQSPKISFAEAEYIRKSRCRTKFFYCRNGRPNAMDFCVMTKLGMSVQKHPDAIHLVFSRDKGYLSGVEALREQGFFVGEVMPEEGSGRLLWVSDTETDCPYGAVAGLLEESAQPQLPHAGTLSRRRRRQSRTRSSTPAKLTEGVLEKELIRILCERFEFVGVDRKRKQLGQLLKKGLHSAFREGELSFDRLEPVLKRLALFRDDDEKVSEFLNALSEIDGLLISFPADWGETGRQKTSEIPDSETEKPELTAEQPVLLPDTDRSVEDTLELFMEDDLELPFQ